MNVALSQINCKVVPCVAILAEFQSAREHLTVKDKWKTVKHLSHMCLLYLFGNPSIFFYFFLSEA